MADKYLSSASQDVDSFPDEIHVKENGSVSGKYAMPGSLGFQDHRVDHSRQPSPADLIALKELVRNQLVSNKSLVMNYPSLIKK